MLLFLKKIKNKVTTCYAVYTVYVSVVVVLAVLVLRILRLCAHFHVAPQKLYFILFCLQLGELRGIMSPNQRIAGI